MSERKPGYYMIRYAHEQASWDPAEWDGERWILLGNGGSFSAATIGEIGPRIPTPDEPWQCVPVEPTQKMRQSTGLGAQRELAMWKAWDAMLESAPKPEEI